MPQRLFTSLVYALLCLLAIQGHAGWEALEGWQWRNPLPQGNGLNALAEGNGRIVAVGSNGTTIVSLDGLTWVSQVSNTQQLNGVAFGTNQFIAVGKAGVILATETGANWLARVSGTAQDLNAITYCSNTFLAVGENGTILTSSNGVQWTSQTLGFSISLKTCAYGNGNFAIGGSIPSGDPCGIQAIRLNSTNGINWEMQTSINESSIVDICWAGTKFMAVTTTSCDFNTQPIYSESVDGRSWTRLAFPVTVQPRSIAADPSRSVIATSSNIFLSYDRMNWTTVSSITNTADVLAIGGRFIAVTRNGSIYISSNGVQWVNQLAGTRNSLAQIATQTNNQVMVAIDARVEAGSRIATSTNGVSWSEQLIIGYKLTDLIFANGKFHIIGTEVAGPNALFSSSDGVGWTLTSIYNLPFPANGIARGGNVLVVVTDNGGVLTSSDSVQWTTRNSGTNANLVDIVYGNGVFLCRNSLGGLHRSANGIDWVPCPTPAGQTYSGIIAGNGVLLAFNTAADFATSADGLTWTSGSLGANFWGATTFANGSFVTVTPEAVLTSTNGANWTRWPSNLPFAKTPSPNGPAVSFGTKNLVLNRHRFTMLGPEGAILQSGDIGASTLAAKGFQNVLQITLNGEMNRPYTIQQSVNLTNWTFFGSVTTSNFQATFQDTNGVDSPPRKYYRAIGAD